MRFSFAMMRGANDIYPPNKYNSSKPEMYFAVSNNDLNMLIMRDNIFAGFRVPSGEPSSGKISGVIPDEA